MQQIPFFYVTLCGKIQKFREITQIHKFVCFHGKTLKKFFFIIFHLWMENTTLLYGPSNNCVKYFNSPDIILRITEFVYFPAKEVDKINHLIHTMKMSHDIVVVFWLTKGRKFTTWMSWVVLLYTLPRFCCRYVVLPVIDHSKSEHDLGKKN